MSTEEEKPRIGVFICKCGKNIASKVAVENVAKYAENLENVEFSQINTFTCSAVGQGAIEEAVKTHNLNRVVVASCSPTMHESTFQTVTEEAGLNKYQFQMANIREFASWVTKDPEQATEKAKRLISGAVARVGYHEPLEESIVPINPNTLIIGGGIAGISAALKIADAGHRVYLVEKTPSIGGRMAQLDKTFPTLDCAACILTPKMVDIGKHPNVELLSYSEVVSVDGYVGNFQAKIRKKPRYVDMEKCTACDDCSDVCPVLVPDEFNEGLSMRRAIYVPFPQAVPQKYTIDKHPDRSPCRVSCPIDNNPHAYVRLISEQKYDVALSKIREANPFPSICGRVCEHTCEDVCKRGEYDDPVAIMSLKRFASDYFRNNEDPVEVITPTRNEKVAIIGAGPSGLTCANNLLEKGYPVTVFEQSDKPGGLMTSCLPSYRIPEEVAMYDVKRILDRGVNYKNNTKVGKDITLEDLQKEYQAIFVAIGMQNPAKLDLPGIDLKGVLYGLPFLKEAKTGNKPKDLGNKVIVIGGGNVAIDCAKSALRLGAKEVNVVCLESRDLSCDDAMPAHEWEIEDTEEEGIKIHTYLGPEKILGEDGKIKGMETKVCVSVYSEDGSFHPLYSGEKGPTLEGDTVIIAIGQRTDLTGFESLETGIAGTLKADNITYETSQPGIFAGGDIVFGTPSVVNAVMEGTEAAISIDRFLNNEDLKAGRIKDMSKVEIVDRDVEIKSRVRMSKAPVAERIKDFREIDLGYSEEEAITEAERCISCAVCCECLECDIICEPKAIDHTQKEEILEVDVGAIVVATGFDGFDATRKPEYGYKKYPNVITSLEFERLSSASGPTEGDLITKDGRPIESVAILHCVGSRDINTNQHCSRLCCMNALKDANIIREKLPDSTVYEFYIDIRAAGKGYEEYYQKMLRSDIRIIRGKVAEITNIPDIKEDEGKLIVVAEDTLIGAILRVPVDLVILMVGIEPKKDARDLAHILHLPCTEEGFYVERHPKLAPTDTVIEGIHVAGTCQFPKDVPDSVAQGESAAASVLSKISRGEYVTEPTKAHIEDDLCSGCRNCIGLCPYLAISFDEEKEIAHIDTAVCAGCGVCVASCPSGAIIHKGYTDEQIFAEIQGVLTD